MAVRRGVLSLPADLPLGTKIDLRLEMPQLLVDEPDAAVIWRGTLASAQFEVAVPGDARLGTTIGRIRFSIADLPAGTLRFQVAVAAVATNEAVRAADIAVRRYRRAFVSYSSQDRAEVLRRVQAFRIAGLSVFQDVLDLEPGERWERELYREIDNYDVLLLFWSKAAAASPWVATLGKLTLEDPLLRCVPHLELSARNFRGGDNLKIGDRHEVTDFQLALAHDG